MATRSASTPPDAQRPQPLFVVHVGYETLHGPLRELASGAVIAPGQLVPYLTQADVQRVVYDGRSQLIDLRARTRFFTGAKRTAIQLATGNAPSPAAGSQPKTVKWITSTPTPRAGSPPSIPAAWAAATTTATGGTTTNATNHHPTPNGICA
jgi:hypothetical protein